MISESSIQLSTSSSSIDTAPNRFSIARLEYITFIQKFLRENADALFQLTPEALVVAYEYKGQKCRDWLAAHESNAQIIAHYKLRSAQIVAIKPELENFHCLKLRDLENFLEKFHMMTIINGFETMRLGFGRMDPPYDHLRSQLEALRFMNGESTVCENLLKILRKDYLDWLNQRVRYLFPLTVERGYELEIKAKYDWEDVGSSDSDSGEKEVFSIDSNEKIRSIVYIPQFTLKVSDRVGGLISLTLQLGVFSESSFDFSRVSHHCALKICSVMKSANRSFKGAVKCLNILYKDYFDRQRSIRRYVQMRSSMPKKPTLKPLDLSKVKSSPEKMVEKKKSSLSRSLNTPRKLSSTTLTSSAAAILEMVSMSPTFSNFKSHSARELDASKVPTSGSISKATSFHYRSSKKKSKEDFSDDIDLLIPTMLSFLHRSTWKKRVKKYLNRHLEGYESKHIDALLSEEWPRIFHYQSLSEELHKFIHNFLFHETGFEKFNEYEEAGSCYLMNDSGFYSMLTRPDNFRHFLGKLHRKIDPEVKDSILLQAIFRKIYHAGYNEKDFGHSPHPEHYIDWLAELRAKQFERGIHTAIQECLLPLITGSEWVESVFFNLFPFLNQKLSSESSAMESSEEVQTKHYCIQALPTREKDISIKQTDHYLTIDKQFEISLKLSGSERPFVRLTVSDMMIKNIKKKRWDRKLRVRKIDFLKGTLIELCQFFIHYLIEAANARDVMKRDKPKDIYGT